MNKLKKFFLKIFYGLPYGMKAADSEIMGSSEKDGFGVSVNQEVSDERVAKHLLKGEVTQEVEELRYRTYKVSNESEKYKYIGNGLVIKNMIDDEYSDSSKYSSRYKFTQCNEAVCQTVLDTLKQVGSYGVDKYRFEIVYNSFVKFKIEKFATKVDIDIDDKAKRVETSLHFNSEPNPYDAASMPFINEIKRLYEASNKHEVDRNEIANSINCLSFTTYKADNEEDFVTYSFVDGAKFKSIKFEKYEYIITFSWEAYFRLPSDLESKYYSKTMAEKYEKKEKKDAPVAISNVARKRYCSVCGKEMSLYDGDIQAFENKKPICNECMQKVMQKK